MININNTVYIDFLIQGESAIKSITNFNYLVIEENLGLEAPVFEISLTLKDADILKKFKINQKCKIKFGRGKETAVSYDFLLINYTFSTDKSDAGGFQIIFSGVADIMDFYFKNKIEVFHDKASYQALSGAITTLAPKIEYQSSDIQHWIRHNTSERQFALETLTHTWINENTFPIFGVSIDKKLIIKDASKALVENKATIQNTDNCTPTSICYNSLQIESNNAITSMFLGSGKLMPTLSVKDWKRKFLTTDLKSLDGKNYFAKTSTNTFKTEIDTLTTHSMFFTAEARNLSKWSQLEMNNMFINTPTFIPESTLTIGDGVEFVSKEKHLNLKIFNGNWIVGGKIYRFGKRDVSVNLKLMRDFVG